MRRFSVNLAARTMLALPLCGGLEASAATIGATDHETAEHFIERCEGASKACVDDVYLIAARGLTKEGKYMCLPMDDKDGPVVTAAVVQWVKSHDAIRRGTAADAIRAALDALYPCK